MKLEVKTERTAQHLKGINRHLSIKETFYVIEGYRIVPMTRTNAPTRDIEESTEWYRRPAYEPSFREMEAAHLDRMAGEHGGN